MGGEDKGLRYVGGRTLIEWVLTALRPQVSRILISANRNLDRYAAFGLPVVRDRLPGFQGPLAGVDAALQRVDTPWLAVVPCDGPALPADLVGRLSLALHDTGASIAVVHDGADWIPTYAMVSTALSGDLSAYLERGGRSLRGWYERHAVISVNFSEQAQSFVNVNSLDDLSDFAARVPRAECLVDGSAADPVTLLVGPLG